MKRRLSIYAGLYLTIAVTCPAQSIDSIKGAVFTQDGTPISAVHVIGGSEETNTNATGEFSLNHPGQVVRFSKEGLQPRAIILVPGSPAIRVVMNVAENNLIAPQCFAKKGEVLIHWGGGLGFHVPKSAKVRGGKPDVDYVRYLIRSKSKTGSAYLALWFGGMAFSPQPPDSDFLDSAEFSQRNLVISGEPSGLDTKGVDQKGLLWRRTGDIGSGAEYRGADKETAALFDEIIDSICVDPPAKH